MLEIKFIRENPQAVKEAIQHKNEKADIDQILALDQKRREIIAEVERLKALRNNVSEQIAQKKRKKEDASSDIAEMKNVGDKIAQLDENLRQTEAELEPLLLRVPNLPHPSVPVGADEESNMTVKEWGTVSQPTFTLLPHWDLGKKLNILDLESGAKISGSGFFVLKGAGARLQRALINFMLDLHIRDGFTEVRVPYLVNSPAMTGTGQLPKMADDLYKIEDENLWLIPTAEVPVTNFHREEILTEEQLPIYYVAYTPCFRREAGAAGKDTRGMIRVHQFDKVELVKIVHPEKSYDEHETLLQQAEKVLQALKIPYRVRLLCTGDLSFAGAKCYDIELWSAGVGKFLEVSSVSNFEAFQARRMNTRFRDKNKRVQFVHTLNGSGTALPRLISAVMENYQTEYGTILIPEALRAYMGGITEITGDGKEK